MSSIAFSISSTIPAVQRVRDNEYSGSGAAGSSSAMNGSDSELSDNRSFTAAINRKTKRKAKHKISSPSVVDNQSCTNPSKLQKTSQFHDSNVLNFASAVVEGVKKLPTSNTTI